ncbi:MAG: epoxyqueuosine reductase QueH [Brevinemataceae bacterium]
MKKLLLQTCCAPCVTTCVEVLRGNLEWKNVLEYEPNIDEIVIYFYNPNIHPEDEYHKRALEAKRYADIAGCRFIEGTYETEIWYDRIKGLENQPEKGHRCTTCYGMRLQKTFDYAVEHGFDAVASTLTLSPHKDEKRVNAIGKVFAEKTGIEYLVSNFKKNNGFKISKELSREHCVYCQNYCGCEFSLAEKLSRSCPS